MKKKLLPIIFSVVSGLALLLEALGVNAGDPVIDGIISGISGLLMTTGVITAAKKEKQ